MLLYSEGGAEKKITTRWKIKELQGQSVRWAFSMDSQVTGNDGRGGGLILRSVPSFTEALKEEYLKIKLLWNLFRSCSQIKFNFFWGDSCR